MYDIYNDIATRTNGDIYLGVVGPVRTGKSTFIKRFMETLVIDRIEDEDKRARAIDELPQSADGKTIMTTEPKFVPNEAINLKLGSSLANFRLIDCVGYLVEGAIGHKEGNKERLVKTPWSNDQMTFEKASEIGTSKVIKEHSTIGIVVTTDGSITELTRSKYIAAEERVIKELQSIGKPFTIILNTANPQMPDTIKLAESLSERYGVKVRPINVQSADKKEFESVLSDVIMEFPIKRIDIDMPKWMRALDSENPIISEILSTLISDKHSVRKMKDYEAIGDALGAVSSLEKNLDISADSGRGTVKINLEAREGLFYEVLKKVSGEDIGDDYNLMNYVVKVSKAYNEYEKIREAMEAVKKDGYGIVNPTLAELELEEPTLVKKGGLFGVKLKASAPSLHIMRVDVETELSPIIGSEQQSQELVKNLLDQYSTDKVGVWDTKLLGKSLSSLIGEDLNYKIASMPIEVRHKMTRTLTRIINEGKGGVICILL